MYNPKDRKGLEQKKRPLQKQIKNTSEWLSPT